jgi:ferrous iron transport protein B
VVRRETNSWKWPVFQFHYMTALAWILAWVAATVSKWFGA